MRDAWIPLSVPDLGAAEQEAAAAAVPVVHEGRVVNAAIDAFEGMMAEQSGVQYAVALTSGTAAIHLGLIHLGAKPGSVVLTSSMTFAATANAIRYTGAEPIFVDAQAQDANVDVDLMLHAAAELQAAGEHVAAVVPVDLYGRCVDYTRLEPGLAALGIPLFCDAAESVGARHAGRPSGAFGVASALSFNVNKVMTTLGGGMLVSNDQALIAHAHKLAHQAREPVPWYQHTEIGFNYRMSNVTAAIGVAQCERLAELIAGRRRVREAYAAGLADLDGVRILGRGSGDGDADDNCWLTTVIVENRPVDPDHVLAHLRENGIEGRHLWKPMHQQPMYADARTYLNGTADRLFATGVNLPSSPMLTDSEIDRVVAAFRGALGV